MKKITIAGVEFTPAVLDFNVLCVMEECGAPMNEWGKLDMSLLRGYLAACLDISAKQAGELIGAHVVEGGKLDELREAFSTAAEESDFFAALRDRATAAKSSEKE